MDNTRCKFRCQSVMKTEHDNEVVTLAPITAAKDEEDKHFCKYTPDGALSLTITNEKVFGFFEPGKDYYVDISPAPEEKEGGDVEP